MSAPLDQRVAPDTTGLNFFRADPSRSRDAGGAGLGLAIVAAIAAAHGGRAGVHAGPGGVGSSFGTAGNVTTGTWRREDAARQRRVRRCGGRAQ